MKTAGQIAHDVTLLTEEDLYLFNEGSHFQLYDHLGSHPLDAGGVPGTQFAVWAPNAEKVAVCSDFNDWDTHAHQLRPRGRSGIWEGFVPGMRVGSRYKYHIRSRYGGYAVDKADPFGFHHETPPLTASLTWDLRYDWGDGRWMAERAARNALGAPIAVYEVHLGSWMRDFAEGGRHLTYREIAPRLADYVSEMGFTHVEFMPIMEHPFYGSWGYQVTGYFAPTSRYGTPQDLMFLIDYLHQRGIGVFLDWVPSHFPTDSHGLGFFDGTHLFEHGDPRRGFHPDWNSLIFNYGRHEVRSFLISSARFWLDVYHADGLRVDGVASMLYLDYSRKEGEWIPNVYGGRENLEAIAFLRRFNQEVYRAHPSIQTVAEESTAWPMVSKPTSIGGLGFGLKWDMGWMHDMLEYMSRDPIHRKFHHQNLTFRLLYAFSENFMLPLSHDEVVHGKGSLLGKMPGDEWRRFANLRLLFAYMYGQPGKKLLFMGGEFGQRTEWNHDGSLDWHLLALPLHEGTRRLVRDLNYLYRQEAALHELDVDPQGFAWIDCNDVEQSVVSLLRKSKYAGAVVAAAFNFTPVPRPEYRVGVPVPGAWRTILNTDAAIYGGSGYPSGSAVEAGATSWHGHPYSVNLALPPLGAVFLKPES